MRTAFLIVLAVVVVAGAGWTLAQVRDAVRTSPERRVTASPSATETRPTGPSAATAPTPAATPTESTSATSPANDLNALIDQVRPIPARPSPPGYDRSCSPGDGCVFGTEWNDDNSMEFGRNGCDTRNDVLARDLEDVVFKEGTGDCVVLSGRYVEPYTGRPVDFVRGETDLHIDHLVALSLAWDLGANEWSQERRVDFANDPRNLLAVDGPTNQSKSDRGPASWLPVNAGFRCTYVERFVTVLVAWDLPLPAADIDSLRFTAAGC